MSGIIPPLLKRLSITLVALFLLVPTVWAAGTIPLSLTQQYDSLGRPLAGGILHFIQAGTTQMLQNALPHPNPMTLDSAGR